MQSTALKQQITLSPKDVLSSVFGYKAFRGEQEQIINDLIAGQSCGVLMPTGSGKSLCYQIPSICMHGTGIIVSPLIALMNDQVIALREAGVKAAAIHSGIESGALRDTYDNLRRGALDMVYVAPERLVNDGFLDILDNIPIALFAIDEAHCISQWGHDFRPEYRQVSILRTRYPKTPCIAVTATADMATRKDIIERLSLPKLYVAGFDRPNISYYVSIKDNPRSQLMRFLKARNEGESGIIYCLSRKKVEETAKWLVGQGYNALAYHARLDQDLRAHNQERFIKEEGVIMVATIAFGMGIDKPDVRFVAHLDLPKNIEAYYQETGRAGRDGLPAVAWMVYGLQDLALQRQMIEGSDAPEAQKRISRQKLTAFLGYCETATCRRQVLLNYFNDDGEPCGNCDTCLSPPETFNGSIAAQKIMSCILRTGQIYGGGYVIDVLLGQTNERIKNLGHQSLSTFGIGTEHTSKEWQSLLRQLVARGLLYVDMDAHGAIKITQEGVDFLKTKPALLLRLDPKSVGGASSNSSTKTDPALMLERECDQTLFMALKALRMNIAKENNVPPYVVFHDKTLIEMVLFKPSNLAAMSNIPGVGKSKLDKYGQLFLDELNR
ncbi:MAG: DNA helicase RecQ [Alphaproteobacteria bacterium]|nr:DNA helicase RecQ [Alphaproteobacteria bacterium]NCQ89140.1 DNA helicase RecQ [Alphaproteobacteria bacterium]NCT08244.1 DNA helicase RecQ [Alphaproteobacteria bacterium]